MTDPNAPQPAYPPAQPAYGAPAAYGPADFPGKTLGIVGLVLVLVGLVTGISTIIGLILSHIGFAQSKNAGFANGPAKAGIIVGWILIGLWILAGIIIAIVIGIAAANGAIVYTSN